jgi:hypothetical protein
MDDVYIGFRGARPAGRAQGAVERRTENLLRTSQMDADVEVAAREYSPANLRLWGFVGTHSVYDNVDRHQEG